MSLRAILLQPIPPLIKRPVAVLLAAPLLAIFIIIAVALYIYNIRNFPFCQVFFLKKIAKKHLSF